MWMAYRMKLSSTLDILPALVGETHLLYGTQVWWTTVPGTPLIARRVLADCAFVRVCLSVF